MSKERRRERITPEDRPAFYANNVSFRSAVWDFVMDFGVLLESSEERIVYRDEVRITMSPQHAKAFAALLTEHVAAYEEDFGRIPEAPKDEPEEPEHPTVIHGEGEGRHDRVDAG